MNLCYNEVQMYQMHKYLEISLTHIKLQQDWFVFIGCICQKVCFLTLRLIYKIIQQV